MGQLIAHVRCYLRGPFRHRWMDVTEGNRTVKRCVRCGRDRGGKGSWFGGRSGGGPGSQSDTHFGGGGG
jgi:hypothetical protein